MPHILVTGANGFIGSHLVRKLVQMRADGQISDEIVCLVRPTSDLSSLKGLPVKILIGDLRDPSSLVEATRGATRIYHLGAELFGISRKQFRETIVDGTRNLLEAAEKYSAGTLQRFLFVSSQAAAGPSEKNEPKCEDDSPCPPVSWYAEAKLDAESIAHDFFGKLKITIVRPCSVYGERDRALTDVFRAARMRIHAVTGFRKRYTGMIYAGDLVEGILAASESPAAIGQTYFLTNSQNYSVKEMTKAVGRAVGKPAGITVPVPLSVFGGVAIVKELSYLFSRKKPIPSRDKVRDMSQVYWLCTPKKAKRDFGWEAQTPLVDGLRLTGNYYRDEEVKARSLAGESGLTLGLKYFFLATGMGALVEALAAFGKVYLFDPWWIVFVVVPVFWGLAMGSLARAVRALSPFVQVAAGFVILFGAELLNHFVIHKWHFGEGTALAAMNPFWRAGILGLGTGLIVLAINGLMRQFWRRRRRLG
jgi:nucleoside-diphosphate-sugar epimerase